MSVETKSFEETKESKTRSGFVAIVGFPNVGKSTLLNHIIGTKVSIVSPKPQTTRFNIRGVLTQDNYQIVFIDTPGIHDAKSLFNKMMVEEALEALEEVDIILWVVDVTHRLPEEERLLDIIKKANKPTILVLNKIDLIKKSELLPMIDYFSKLHDFKAIIPVSALKNDGIERIIDELVKLLPEGPFYYEPERVTDLPLSLLVAEIIREKIFQLTYQEIPYSTAVKVEQIRERRRKKLALYPGNDIYRKRFSKRYHHRETRPDVEKDRHPCKRRIRISLRKEDILRPLGKNTKRLARKRNPYQKISHSF